MKTFIQFHTKTALEKGLFFPFSNGSNAALYQYRKRKNQQIGHIVSNLITILISSVVH